MKFGSFAKHAEKAIADNAPMILTAIGAAGAVFTAYLVGKASFRAARIIVEEEVATEKVRIDMCERGESEELIAASYLDTRAKIDLVWKEYVPAVVMGAISVTAIIGSNHISTRRAAVLAGAYSLSEKAFTEYKEKVLSTVGKNKEQKIRDDLAQDRVTRRPSSIVVSGGKQLFRESFTNQDFESTVETVKAAVNKINHRVNNDSYASLSDFYKVIGVPVSVVSEEFGWTSDKLMEVTFHAVLDGDRAMIVLEYPVMPIRGYYKFG